MLIHMRWGVAAFAVGLVACMSVFAACGGPATGFGVSPNTTNPTGVIDCFGRVCDLSTYVCCVNDVSASCESADACAGATAQCVQNGDCPIAYGSQEVCCFFEGSTVCTGDCPGSCSDPGSPPQDAGFGLMNQCGDGACTPITIAGQQMPFGVCE
jgi:hypothetical protein